MKILTLFLTFCLVSFGAVSAGTVHQVFSTGAAGNGGGFSVDATFTADGAATVATGTAPVFTSASYNFVAGDVGAKLFIKSGTNWIPGWYTIASVAANAATLTATIGSVTLYDTYKLNTTAGAATVASPTGATWGVDYSHQVAPEISFTDLVIGGSDVTATSATSPINDNMIGNVFNITAGAGCTVQHATLVSLSGSTGTFNSDLGTAASTCTAAMGGAKDTMTAGAAIVVAGNIIGVKATATYTITATQTFSVAGTAGNPITMIGYTTTLGDEGMVTVNSATNGVNAVAITAAHRKFYNFNLTTSGAPTTNKGFVVTAASVVLGHTSTANHSTNGYECGTGSINLGVFDAYSTADNVGFNGTTAADGCIGAMIVNYRATGSTSHGMFLQGGATSGSRMTCVRCIFDNNGGDGVRIGDSLSVSFINSVFYSNTGDGLEFNGAGTGSASVIVNSVFVTDTANFGIRSTTTNWTTTGTRPFISSNNAFLNSGGGASASQYSIGIRDITLSADPFTSSSDFSLNNTAGGGAALRNTGFPGVLQAGGTGYLSVGALEVQSSGGGQKGYTFQ